MKFKLSFIFASSVLALPAMELPSQEQVLSNRIPALKVLAARASAPFFDPSKNYQRACNLLTQINLPADIGQLLTPEIASECAQSLELFLDEVTQPAPVKLKFKNPKINLYEKNHGICWKGQFFPPLEFPPVYGYSDKPQRVYKCAVISDDNTQCAAMDGDRPADFDITIWDIQTGNKIGTVHLDRPINQFFNFLPVKFLSDKNVLLTGYMQWIGAEQYGYFYRAINTQTNQTLYDQAGWAKGFKKNSIFSVSIPDNNKFLLKDIVTNRLLSTIPADEPACLLGDYIITLKDTELSIWNPESVEPLIGSRAGIIKNPEQITDFCISSHAGLVATTDKKSIAIWNPYTTKQIMSIPHSFGNKLRPACFSNNNKQLITFCTLERTFQIWDLVSKKIIIQKKVAPTPQDAAVAQAPYKGIQDISLHNNGDLALVDLKEASFMLIYKMHSSLGHELSLKELSALLILEHNRKTHQNAFAPAFEIIRQSKNDFLKLQLANKRYELSREELVKRAEETIVNGCKTS